MQAPSLVLAELGEEAVWTQNEFYNMLNNGVNEPFIRYHTYGLPSLSLK